MLLAFKMGRIFDALLDLDPQFGFLFISGVFALGFLEIFFSFLVRKQRGNIFVRNGEL